MSKYNADIIGFDSSVAAILAIVEEEKQIVMTSMDDHCIERRTADRQRIKEVVEGMNRKKFKPLEEGDKSEVKMIRRRAMDYGYNDALVKVVDEINKV